MLYRTLPELIRGRCKALPITQRGISQEFRRRGLPTHENTVSVWVTGQGSPEPDRLEMLLDILGVYGEQRRAIVYRLTYAPDAARPVAGLQMPAQGDQPGKAAS